MRQAQLGQLPVPKGRAIGGVPAGREPGDPLEGGDYGVVAAPAAGGLRVGADRVVGQLQAGDGVSGGEQLQAAVVPVIGGVGIAQHGVDLLSHSPFSAGGLSTELVSTEVMQADRRIQLPRLSMPA